jgi:hypothetical protein
MVLAAALLVSGCAGDAFVGSPHGYSGRVDSPWADFGATPTILQPGEMPLQSEYGADGGGRDMPSTYTVDIAGNVSATGYAAYWMALANFCARAPAAPACLGPQP